MKFTQDHIDRIRAAHDAIQAVCRETGANLTVHISTRREFGERSVAVICQSRAGFMQAEEPRRLTPEAFNDAAALARA